MKKYLSNCAQDTKQIAQSIAKKINIGVIALTGELGAGKTTFVQGFAQGLGINEKIISPTFVLIKQYQIPHTNSALYHIDLYRLENDYQLQSLGFRELINNPSNLLLIEWAEKVENYLPKNSVKILIEKIGPNQRRFIIHNS